MCLCFVHLHTCCCLKLSTEVLCSISFSVQIYRKDWKLDLKDTRRELSPLNRSGKGQPKKIWNKINFWFLWFSHLLISCKRRCLFWLWFHPLWKNILRTPVCQRVLWCQYLSTSRNSATVFRWPACVSHACCSPYSSETKKKKWRKSLAGFNIPSEPSK